MLKESWNEGARAAKVAFGENVVSRNLRDHASRGLSGLASKGMDVAKWMAVGQAPQVFTEGPRTFSPGGTLHWRNVLWPTIPGSPGKQMLGRAGSVLTLAALPGMMGRDRAHGEGRLSSLLGSVGSLAGMMYGGSAGGLMGTPVGTAVGHRLGLGLGHLLGDRRKEFEE